MTINTGDTAWMLISTALVMLMTPGLALFYGGMVRRKNVLATLLQSFIALGVITLVWTFYGYSLAFGPDVHGIIGDFSWVGLRGVGIDPYPEYVATVPHLLFMAFQMMFAIITPALITGAFAERFKFSTYLVFLVLWSTFVYIPLAHWVWGVGGWMRSLGVLDFAGGLVVHISSGFSALAAALMVGNRFGHPHEPMPPHNLTMTLLGAAVLWFGWFGFNGGSALSSNALAVSAFVTTHIAAASAAFSWLGVEWIVRRKPTLLGAASGGIAGLVAITPGAGFVSPLAAVAIGIGAGAICYLSVNIKQSIGFDDSLDAVGVHGIGGTFGALATGIFASTSINPAGVDGLLYGNVSLLSVQMLSVAVAIVYSFGLTWLILKVLERLMGLRVDVVEELEGLDVSQHGERGYSF